MISKKPVTANAKLAVDAFPLPPAKPLGSRTSSKSAVSPRLPHIAEVYREKALPPLPSRFRPPSWEKTRSSREPTPLSVASPSSAPPSPRSNPTPSFLVRPPLTSLREDEKTNRYFVGQEMSQIGSWARPVASIGNKSSVDTDVPSLTDATSRNSSVDSRPTTIDMDDPVSPSLRKHIPPPMRTSSIPSVTPLVLSSKPRNASKELVDHNSPKHILKNSYPRLLSPSGHNSAPKIQRMFGADDGLATGLSAPPVPVVSSKTAPQEPRSMSVLNTEVVTSTRTTTLEIKKPNYENWMEPSPTLPPLDIGGCGSLNLNADSFRITEPPRPERPQMHQQNPSVTNYPHSNPVRDLHHSSALRMPDQVQGKEEKDGDSGGDGDGDVSNNVKKTVLEVPSAKKSEDQKRGPKSPAQYSFFPRSESFSARRRSSAMKGNRKLPPTPLMPRPNFVLGKHPMRTPFPGGSGEPPSAPILTPVGLSPIASPLSGSSPLAATSAPLSTPLILGTDGRLYDYHFGAGEGEAKDAADLFYRSQPKSAFEFGDNGNNNQRRSSRHYRFSSGLSEVFKRHSPTSSRNKRLSAQSLASSIMSSSSTGTGTSSGKKTRDFLLGHLGVAKAPTTVTPEPSARFISSDVRQPYSSSPPSGWFGGLWRGSSGPATATATVTSATTTALSPGLYRGKSSPFSCRGVGTPMRPGSTVSSGTSIDEDELEREMEEIFSSTFGAKKRASGFGLSSGGLSPFAYDDELDAARVKKEEGKRKAVEISSVGLTTTVTRGNVL